MTTTGEKKDLRHIIKWKTWTLLDSWFEQDANGNKIIRRQLGKFKERRQLILEEHRLVVPFLHTVKNPRVTCDSPETSAVPQNLHRGWFQDPLQLPNSVNVQVPYIKWCKTMHTVSPWLLRIYKYRWKILFSICNWLNPQIRNRGIQRAGYLFIEKNLRIGEPT